MSGRSVTTYFPFPALIRSTHMAKEHCKSLNASAGAWAIIHCADTGKFLLGKRSAAVNNGGAWNFFGGRVDRGEAPGTALLRELAEEAGLRIKPKQLVKLGRVSGEGRRGNKNRDLHYYLLKLEREVRPRLNQEHSDFRWFNRQSLPSRFNRPTMVAIKQGLLNKVKA